MTLYAILSDIHGNYPALRAVAREARAIVRQEDDGRVEFISLGDVVDYGPQPNECVAWVRRYARVTIQGNHDRLAAEPLTSPPTSIEPNLWPALIWTRAELSTTNRLTLGKWAAQRGASPLLAAFTAFHSDLDESDAYINNPRTAARTLERLRTPYGLFGHTHIQGGYLQAGPQIDTLLPAPAAPPAAAQPGLRWQPLGEWFTLPTDGQRIILNPGSVGQPRQHTRLGGAFVVHDYRAAYLLLRQQPGQGWHARFQRVAYPIETTLRRMHERMRWDAQRVQREPSPSRDQATPAMHPFAARMAATIAGMDEQLPRLVQRLAEFLRPPVAEM